jgi:hypothetical protein
LARTQDLEVAKNGLSLLIVYHFHLIENNGFLEDLVWYTKALPENLFP